MHDRVARGDRVVASPSHDHRSERPADVSVRIRPVVLDARSVLALQRAAGNRALTSTVVQRQAAPVAFSNMDNEFARFAMMTTNTFLLSEADFAPVAPGRVQTWKTVSAGGELDEDHFYTDAAGNEQHVKVHVFLDSDAGFRARICSWNADGQEISLKRISGWLEDQGDGTCVLHVGDKPRPPDPTPSTPSGPSNVYDDDENVMV